MARAHGWSTDPSSASPLIHLVRHGETREYRTDAGLTTRGRTQAFEAGVRLAGSLRQGDRVEIVHSPRARTSETAWLLRRGALDELRSSTGAGPLGVAARLGEPIAADDFDNFHILIEGRELEITAAFGRFARARAAGEAPDAPTAAGWVVEAERFWQVHESGGDPIRHWLTQPLQHIEPAAVVVRRLWTAILRATAATTEPDHLVICSHSGPIRALAAQAFGEDPGEPEHLEELLIALEPTTTRAALRFRDRTTELDIPIGVTPSWVAS